MSLASLFILRSSRPQTTVIFLSRIMLSNLNGTSFCTITKSGLISLIFCSRILSVCSSRSIFVAKSGMMKFELRESSYARSLSRRILGLIRHDSILLLAMLLLITKPFTYCDLELSFQSMIFTFIASLMSIGSESILDEGFTYSTALITKPDSRVSHLSKLSSLINSCSQTTFWMWRLEYSIK